eukprot:7680547-Pyramimonas_sp.AAC.1
MEECWRGGGRRSCCSCEAWHYCATSSYYPPKPTSSQTAAYFKTVKILPDWFEAILGSLPAR